MDMGMKTQNLIKNVHWASLGQSRPCSQFPPHIHSKSMFFADLSDDISILGQVLESFRHLGGGLKLLL